MIDVFDIFTFWVSINCSHKDILILCEKFLNDYKDNHSVGDFHVYFIDNNKTFFTNKSGDFIGFWDRISNKVEIDFQQKYRNEGQ